MYELSAKTFKELVKEIIKNRDHIFKWLKSNVSYISTNINGFSETYNN